MRARRWTWAALLLLAMLFWGAQRISQRDPRDKLLPAEVHVMNRPGLEKPTDFNNLSAEGEEKNLLAALDQSPFFYFAGLDRPADALLLDAGAKDPYQQSGSLFRLSELLKLQISIAGSLEMANLAVRHVDTELAEATRHAYQQARELFKNAAEVVSRYAEVAGQVSHSVLPDLQLAVDEQAPALAADLLEMLKNWVTDMKKDSDVIRTNYGALQSTIGSLADRALQSKQQADVKLAQAVANVQEAMMSENATEKGSCAYQTEPQFQVATRTEEAGRQPVSDVDTAASSWVNFESSVSNWLPSSSEFNRSDMALVRQLGCGSGDPRGSCLWDSPAAPIPSGGGAGGKQFQAAAQSLARVEASRFNPRGMLCLLGQHGWHSAETGSDEGACRAHGVLCFQNTQDQGAVWTTIEGVRHVLVGLGTALQEIQFRSSCCLRKDERSGSRGVLCC